MSKKTLKNLSRHVFVLSLLLHLLLLISFSLIITLPLTSIHKQDERPSLFIPSYLAQNTSAQTEQTPVPQQRQLPKWEPTVKTGIQQVVKQSPAPSVSTKNASASSQSPPNISQYTDTKEQPVDLIGDKKVTKSLIVLLGKALTAHMVYPKIAEDFNIKGQVLVTFVIHPNGAVTDVRLLKSSGAIVLDRAALAAIYAMSPVPKVDNYIHQPKQLHFGIVFR